jgi:ribosomal protein S18 acetylase RimI-like enzyme
MANGIHVIEADYTDPAHAQVLVRLLDLYARDPMGGGEGLSAFAKANVVSELARRPQAFSVLAFARDEAGVEDEAVGLVNCMEGFSTFACRALVNIHDVIVDSRYRGRRVAHSMLQKAEQIARARGACKLTLEVLQGNAGAVRAYQQFGFAGYQLGGAAGTAMFLQKWLD